jgi:uncharacterized protein with NRDE domain
MCLIVAAYRAVPGYSLVVAANRDELHARPARAAAWWSDARDVLAGRDLEAGGTWLAVDRRGRMAAVTNIREGGRRPGPRSRGELVAGYVTGAEVAAGYAGTVTSDGAAFAPFNLLLFDGAELHLASNRAPAVALEPGVHAVSNAPHGIEWPKMASARTAALPCLARPDPVEALFALLAARSATTGEERYQIDHFVVGPSYGTRCSTVLLIDDRGTVSFAERSFDASGAATGEIRERFEVRPAS